MRYINLRLTYLLTYSLSDKCVKNYCKWVHVIFKDVTCFLEHSVYEMVLDDTGTVKKYKKMIV